MVHLMRLLGVSLILYLVQLAQCKSLLRETEAFSSLAEDDINEVFTEILDCVNYTCTWCAKWAKKVKVCNKIGIAEETVEGKTDYSIVYNITVNNNLVMWDSYAVSAIPPVCYEAVGVRGCFKLILKKQDRKLLACGSLVFHVANSSLPEYDFYCLQIPSGNRPGRLNQSIKDSEKGSADTEYFDDLTKFLRSFGFGGSHTDPVPWDDEVPHIKSIKEFSKFDKPDLENHGKVRSASSTVEEGSESWKDINPRDVLVRYVPTTTAPSSTRPPLPPIPVLPINPY